jgi:toxin secretion/phage lysis holin
MKTMLSSLKWVAASIGSVWLSLAVMIQLLLLLMGLDFLTGLMCAARDQNLSSKEAWLGVLRKCAVLIVVLTVHLLQRAVALSQGLHFAINLGEAVSVAYVFTESISILENCHLLGAPIPAFLVKALKKYGGIAEMLKEKDQGDKARGAASGQ